MRAFFLASVVLLLVAEGTQAQNSAAIALSNARSLRCHFTSGIATQWKNGKADTASAKNEQTVQFDSIDLRANKARLIGNLAAVDVSARMTPVGITFVETSPAIFATTTVFAAFAGDREFLAVDTRHGLLPGTAITFAEQYPGTCAVWE